MTRKAKMRMAFLALTISVVPGHPALSVSRGVMVTVHRQAKGGDGDDGDS